MLTQRDRMRHERQAQVMQALAHPTRVAIVEFLRDEEQCVQDIADHVGAERSNVSRHLALMLKAGILSARKEGVMVYYSLQTLCALKFLGCATDVLQLNLRADAKALR